MVDSDFIDKGDRVVVKSVEPVSNSFGLTTLRHKHLGAHATVLHNDGWGHCVIQFDDGTTASCWNTLHLKRAE